jgi:hypothetical protein
MEALKEKLYRYIEQYGLVDSRTVEVSQELDVLIIKAMKGGILDVRENCNA